MRNDKEENVCNAMMIKTKENHSRANDDEW